MEETKGRCKHGEFIIRDGCPLCIAERQGREGNTEESIAEAVKAAQHPPDVPPGLREMEEGLRSEGLTLASAEAYHCPPDCRFCIPSGGPADNPEIGGCAVEDKIPPGARYENNPLLPLCPEYRWFTPAAESESATETAVALRPGEDMEAHGYYADGVRLLEYAQCRVIKTLEDNKSANDDLSMIAKLKKVMENKRKALLDPLKLQSDAIRETYNYLMAPVLEADKITRDKMLAYDAEQRRIRAEQEEINRKRQEAAEQEMKLKGELSESVNLVEVTPEPAKRVSTDMGTTGMVDHWKYEVVDFSLLPDEYKVADSAMLNAAAKKHHDQKQIPGVRFYNEPIIAVRVR